MKKRKPGRLGNRDVYENVSPIWMNRTLFFTALAALAALIACGPKRESVPVATLPPIILISIDTLRSDHLPIYGYAGVATPHIDALRRDAILFRRAYAPTPMTLPSHVTMLTGLLPTEHGVRDNVGFRVDPKHHRHLPGVLKSRGYLTAAAVSSYVLRGDTGLREMFDFYDDAIDTHAGAAFREFQRSGELTAKATLSWLAETRGRPFFLFFHIYEPHVPYEAPRPFRDRYPNAYDAEIAAADAIVGTLLADLKRRNLYDGALIVLTSDHGEGLGDHGEDQHSIFVYRESIQVPLIIKLPANTKAGQERSEPVTLADIAPTLLSLVGDTTPQTTHGRPLIDRLLEDRPVYSESLYPRYHFGWSELRSVIAGRWHFIDAPKSELFDVVADPAETNNLAESERREVARLRALLDRYGRQIPALSEIDPEEAKRLESLGYLGRAANRATDTLANPRDEIHHLERMREALGLAERGEAAQAIDAYRRILRTSPDMHEVRTQLAETLAASGRPEEALTEYRQALERGAASPKEISLAMGELFLQLDRLEEAKRYAEAGGKLNQRRGRALRMRIAVAERNTNEALRIANEGVESDQALPADMLLLAEAQIAAGQSAAALEVLRRADQRARDLRLSKVHRLQFLRGDALGRIERLDEAIAAYELEIAAFPDNQRAYSNLAILHYIKGDHSRFEATLRRLVRANPGPAARALAERTRDAVKE